ncbi:AmpG family muropeptide MFS transporter [Azospirillum picis]|uniref:PAT family beta-lactamase induction signal transducer AmpG n=1 Tax=Azospirillum picis TaxID=488438 RepID=A0ABU0MIN3_9PROT|nr:MFS transporter [Azospirillum picis]MBP2299199.1 PAT family beta-lactamase induction signal transducer AmpG [Azospirillum picis]MDQ0533163.1 PAT family beta-lactamase induction signal transducer AmpG [Azospirillum picis]
MTETSRPERRPSSRHPSWLQALAVYRDPRVLAILFLGFSEGLPLALTGATLNVWLTEEGVSRTSIGLFALVTMPYALKFLWAPLIDRLRLPVMTRLFGRRRGWALTAQAALVAALLALGSTNPGADLWWTALCAVLVAFCSASQDIVVDAYRVEVLEESRQAAGSAVLVLGYRFGLMAAGAGALYIAQFHGWRAAYEAMAALVLVGMVTILLSPEPKSPPPSARERRIAEWLEARPHLSGRRAVAVAWIYGAVVAPFLQFMERRGWMVILAFIASYKLGEVLAGQMSSTFYIDLGFTKAEIATVSKLFGLWATIAGGLLGGLLVGRVGVLRGLMIGGVLQMVSNLGYVALAWTGNDVSMLAATVATDNICGGIATAAFVAYLSSLCNAAYTATQYALLSSLYKLGGDLFGASSGWLAERMDWTGFFLLSMAGALPALALLVWLTGLHRREQAAAVPAQ